MLCLIHCKYFVCMISVESHTHSALSLMTTHFPDEKTVLSNLPKDT